MKKPILAVSLSAPANMAGAKGFELIGKLDLFGGQYFFWNQAGAFNGYGVPDVQLAKNHSSSSGYFISARPV